MEEQHTLDVLKKVRKVFSDKKYWTKHQLRSPGTVSPRSRKHAYCIVGAIGLVEGTGWATANVDTVCAIAKAMNIPGDWGWGGLVDFNNSPRTTWSIFTKRIDTAIKRLQQMVKK